MPTPDPALPTPQPPAGGNVALGILAVLALVAALYFARAFVVSLLLGILASYALYPVVEWLNSYRLPKSIAAALVLGVIVSGLSWMALSLSDDAMELIETLPSATHKLHQRLAATPTGKRTALQAVQEAANDLVGAVAEAVGGAGAASQARSSLGIATSTWLRDYLLNQALLLIAVIAQTPIVLLLCYFLLVSGGHFRKKLVKIAGPSLSRKKDTVLILGEIHSQIQRYLFTMLTTNILLGITVWLAFSAMGMEGAGVWGVVAGVLHFIPYLGPAALAVASTFAAFLQFDSMLSALAIGSVSILLAGAIGMLFMTWMQSRLARVNVAVLFIALLFLGWLWGIWGVLLGGPLVAIAKVVCDRVESLKPVGELLG